MKKALGSVLLLILVLASILALVGCQTEQNDIYTIANSSPATHITTEVEYVYDGEVFSCWYDILVDGDDAIVDYRYQKYRTLDEGVETGGAYIEEQSGVIYYYDGVYHTKTEEGVSDSWVSAAADADFKFILVESLLISPKVSTDGTKLTATMTPENCETMFGFDFDAEGELTLEVVTNGVNLEDVNISCTTTNGAKLKFLTTYAARTEELDFSPIINKAEE